MAKALPLPRYDELPEVVLFHRTHPASPRLLLQVPTGQETAETYVINLEQKPAPVGEYDPRTDHKGWMERLPGSRALMDKLSYEMHVAYYYSRNGTSMILDDPDNIPWVRMVMMMARMSAPDGTSMEAYFTRRRAQARVMPPMPVRTALQRPQPYNFGIPGGARW